MSFSGEVRAELAKQLPSARHCQIAELAAILYYSGCLFTKDQSFLELQSESSYVIQKAETLLKKLCGLWFETQNEGEDETQPLQLSIYEPETVKQILELVKFEDGMDTIPSVLLKNQCCKRAMLRGAFLVAGSMSNPEKGYHFEYVCANELQAKQLMKELAFFQLEARCVERKKYQVVYIKESECIVELLNVMGAHVSLMNLENLRILKDMRNSINRRVNCEAANITKTVNAATKQIEDIIYLRDYYGFQNLTDQLQEMAEVRLEYPEATLKELGELLDPPVGKSGVNHRLRKLGEIAEKIRLSREQT